MKKLLFGVTTDPRALGNVLSFLRKKIKPGMNIGVEFTEYHYDSYFNRTGITLQDKFWKKVVDFLKENKCNVVFLDSPELRSEIDAVHRKGDLSLGDAKKVFERENVFLQKIPGCEISVLGAAHAIRLSRKTKVSVSLENLTSLMYKKGLIPLTPEKLINKSFTSKAVSAFETLVQAHPGFYGKRTGTGRQLISERIETLQRLADAGKNKTIKTKKSARPKPARKP